MTGEFDAGGLRVSMAEMNSSPLQTVQIIADMKGWAWASRLWEDWDSRLPQRGRNPHLVAKSIEVRNWLDDHRPGGTTC